jgi:uncharacterized protein YuzB (UPF0349 family)
MHRRQPLRVLLALLTTAALTAAACGEGGDDDDTAAPADSSATTEAPSGEEGALTGMRGTTPLSELSEDFRQRLLEVDPDLADFNYAGESYDNIIITSLAALVAGTDASGEVAAEINGVTKDGEKCDNFFDCQELIAAGTDIDYDGITGDLEFSGNGEPTVASYGVLTFGSDNRIDDEATEYRIATAPEEVAGVPETEVVSDRPGDGVLKFGTLLPETGSLAFLGPPEVAGVKLAIEEVNDNGGVVGADVELVEGDSGDTSTDIANQTVDRLLSQNVDAIIGAASSSVTLTVIDKVTGAGVIMFSPANTSKQFSTYEDEGLYFRTAPSDILQGQVLGEVIIEDGNATVGIMALDDDYGTGLAEDLTESIEGSGGQVVETIIYDPQAQTFDAEVQQLVTADPDAIVVIGFDESARIITTLIEQGIGPTSDRNIYGSDGNMGNALGEQF